MTTTLEPGTRSGVWVIERKHGEGGGFREYAARHEFLGLEAELRLFGQEFTEAPELRRAVQGFVRALAKHGHPAIPPILDFDEAPPENGGGFQVALGTAPLPTLADKAVETPLDTRDRILPFLHAAAAMAVDFLARRLACDRLTLGDLHWDGHGLSVAGIAWGALASQGPIRRRFPSLAAEWERDHNTGVYPVGDDKPPSPTDALVCLGRLAYAAAGLPDAEARILEASRLSADETSAAAPPLVEGWGVSIEAIVRRCLFAHRPGMIDKPETLLEAIEKLLLGETPSAAKALPTLSPESLGAMKSGHATPTANATAAPADSPDATDGLGTKPARSKSSSAAAFTPLGAEASMMDTHVATRRHARATTDAESEHGSPPPPRSRPRSPSKTALDKTRLVKIGAVAGGVLALALVVLCAMAMLGRKPPVNLPPTAVIAPVESPVKPLLPLVFDGSGSQDPEGAPLSYEWSVKGLGAMDYQIRPNNSRAAATPEMRFFKRGTFTVCLRVFDGHHYSETTCLEITVAE